MILALVGCFDAGARIALPQPFYYGYRHAMGTLGVECVPFDTSMESHFQPTVDDIEKIEGEIDGLIFASPGNPTGSMMPREQMQELSDYCQRKEIRLISDEIYHGIVFDDEVPQQTATAFSDEIIVVNSFSKYYSMAGWRLGWMVLPEYLVERSVILLIIFTFVRPHHRSMAHCTRWIAAKSSTGTSTAIKRTAISCSQNARNGFRQIFCAAWCFLSLLPRQASPRGQFAVCHRNARRMRCACSARKRLFGASRTSLHPLFLRWVHRRCGRSSCANDEMAKSLSRF